jgi:hypothetical protein
MKDSRQYSDSEMSTESLKSKKNQSGSNQQVPGLLVEYKSQNKLLSSFGRIIDCFQKISKQTNDL